MRSRFTWGLVAVVLVGFVAAPVALAQKPPAAAKPAAPSKRVVKNAGPDRAFTVLRALLPADVTLVGGIHVAGIRGTDAWKKLRQKAEKDADLRDAIGSAKDACGLDLMEAVQDVAFASRGGTALIAVAWKGIGESELADCAVKVAAAKQAKVQVERGNGRLRVTIDGETLVLAWPAPDVMVFAFDPTDAKALDGMLGGGGAFMARADAKQALARVPAGAVGWGVYLEKERIGALDVRAIVGAVSVASGRLTVQAWITTVDADTAKKTAAEWTAYRDQAAADPGTPEVAKRLLGAVKITADGDELRVSISMSEQDLMLLLALL